jgi:hypothetical protein
MSAQLAERLNSQIGHNAVRTIRFTVSRKVAEAVAQERIEEETDAFYQEDVTEPVPLDETELSQAEQVAAPIKNPALKEIALRVMIADLERKKGRPGRGPRGAR